MSEMNGGYIPPEINNINHIKAILKTLAQIQADTLANNGDNELVSEYSLESITNEVVSLDYFKIIEQSEIVRTLEKLQVSLNALLKSTLLVKSIWSSSQDNVLVANGGTECVFSNKFSDAMLPPAYDALLFIFSLSDENFRQKNFEYLAAYYFTSLTEVLRKESSEVAKKIDRKYSELQMRTLLPVVKFRLAKDLAKIESSPRFVEILKNILNFLKYPLIHQEDVYETAKNVFSSYDYDLINFELVSLDAKNGHLGEYYHLKIKLKFQNKEVSLKLFAKFLMSDIEMLREIIEKGICAKEDFFYSTLYRLYLENGLGCILDFAPKCFLSRLSGVLVLEDFGTLGYTAPKPNVILRCDELKLMLGKLAKFHACSLILEEILSKNAGKKIRLGNIFSQYFEEAFFNYDGKIREWFDSNIECVYYILEKLPQLTKKIDLTTTVLHAKLKEILLSIFSKTKKSETIRNVANHGDTYISNMLLKFGKDKMIEDGVLIDFQMLRYIPPAFEVGFFIFASSTKETRDEHFNSLLDWYYENLSNCLKKFNLELEHIYSKKQFDEDVEYAKPASLAMAFNYGHIIHTDPDFREAISHDEQKMNYYMSGNRSHFVDISWEQEHYRIVVAGIMEDLIDLVATDI